MLEPKELTEAGLAARLQRRLFEADAPVDAGRAYGELSQAVLQVYDGGRVNAEKLSAMRAWLNLLRRRRWIPRMMDTVARMDEALAIYSR